MLLNVELVYWKSVLVLYVLFHPMDVNNMLKSHDYSTSTNKPTIN